MNIASILLRIGALAPVIYYGVLLAASLSWQGFDHMVRPISDLGGAGSPTAEIFNYGLIAAGATAALGGLGAFLGLRRLGAGMVMPFLAFLAIAVGGASLAMAGLYPAPHPLHGGYSIAGYGMGLALLAAPLLMFLGLSDRSDMSGVKGVLILSFVAGLAILGATMNWGGVFNLINESNAGLWQRLLSLTMVPWMLWGFLGIDGRLVARARKARDSSRQVVFGEG